MKEFLIQNRLFQGLSVQDYSFLMNHISQRSFDKNQVVFETGTPAEMLYVVLQGQVKLYNIRNGSPKEEIVCIIGPGNHFCLAPVLSRELMHINAKTLLKTDLLMVPKSALDKLIDESHVFSKNIIRSLAGKECDLCEQVCDLSLTTTKERLAKYLLDQSGILSKSSFKLPIRQNELASHLGTVRETLSRDFSSLKKAGIIEIKASKIKILDDQELRNVAERSQGNTLKILE